MVSHMLDNCLVRNGVHLDGLLYHSVERLPARSRSPSVKPKSELVEVVVKMLMTYRTMEGPCQPRFQQPRDMMHARQNLECRLLPPRENSNLIRIASLFQARTPSAMLKGDDIVNGILKGE